MLSRLILTFSQHYPPQTCQTIEVDWVVNAFCSNIKMLRTDSECNHVWHLIWCAFSSDCSCSWGHAGKDWGGNRDDETDGLWILWHHKGEITFFNAQPWQISSYKNIQTRSRCTLQFNCSNMCLYMTNSCDILFVHCLRLFQVAKLLL